MQTIAVAVRELGQQGSIVIQQFQQLNGTAQALLKIDFYVFGNRLHRSIIARRVLRLFEDDDLDAAIAGASVRRVVAALGVV